MRENGLLAQAHQLKTEEDWMRTRNIEYSNYATTFGFNGKRTFRNVKKPRDLYELPSEIRQVRKHEAVFDLEAAKAAYDRVKIPNKWHKKI